MPLIAPGPVQAFEALRQKVDAFLPQQAETPALERWSDEIVCMTIRLLAFSSEARPRSAMIFLQTPDGDREWKLDYQADHCEHLSFDTYAARCGLTLSWRLRRYGSCADVEAIVGPSSIERHTLYDVMLGRPTPARTSGINPVCTVTSFL